MWYSEKVLQKCKWAKRTTRPIARPYRERRAPEVRAVIHRLPRRPAETRLLLQQAAHETLPRRRHRPPRGIVEQKPRLRQLLHLVLAIFEIAICAARCGRRGDASDGVLSRCRSPSSVVYFVPAYVARAGILTTKRVIVSDHNHDHDNRLRILL